MPHVLDGNCIRITTGGTENVDLSGAGIAHFYRNDENYHSFTYAEVDGEFKYHTPLWVPNYVDLVRFRVADIHPLCPISRGISCHNVEVLQDAVWKKVFNRLLLHSALEMDLSDDDMARYREILFKSEKWSPLTDHERTFLNDARTHGAYFASSLKENLLYQRNKECGTAGRAEVF